MSLLKLGPTKLSMTSLTVLLLPDCAKKDNGPNAARRISCFSSAMEYIDEYGMVIYRNTR